MGIRFIIANALTWIRRLFRNSPLYSTRAHEHISTEHPWSTKRTIAPITVGDLVIGDIYIHIVVQTDLTLRDEEFTPIGSVRKKGDKYTPDLLVIDTFDPTSGKHDIRFVDELGLMPDARTNLHRVFRATDEARGILRDLVLHQEIHQYINMIVETLSEAEEARLSVDGLFESLCEKGETGKEAYNRHFDDLESGENKDGLK